MLFSFINWRLVFHINKEIITISFSRLILFFISKIHLYKHIYLIINFYLLMMYCRNFLCICISYVYFYKYIPSCNNEYRTEESRSRKLSVTSFIQFFFDGYSSVKVNRFCDITWSTSVYICLLLYIFCFVTSVKSSRRKIDDIYDVIFSIYFKHISAIHRRISFSWTRFFPVKDMFFA